MTPAGTSNELDVQNGWEENTHTTHFEVLGITKLFGSTCQHVNDDILYVDYKEKYRVKAVLQRGM